MKWVFAIGAVIFIALYVRAISTVERPPEDGVTRLTWATDPNPARERQTAGFAEMFPGFTARVEPGGMSRIVVRCATGTGPDVIDLFSQTPMEAGVLMDLTDIAEREGFGTRDTYASIVPALLYDGRQYSFPCNVTADAVIYNKAIFDDHGVPYPARDWTYDDFIAAAKGILENPSKSGEKHIAVTNWLNTGFVQNLMATYGVRYYSPDGRRSALDSPEAIEAMQFYDDLIHVHRVVPSASDMAAASAQGGWGSTGLTTFSAGKAAMIFIGRWYIVQAPQYPNLAGNLGAAPVPRIVREVDGKRTILPSRSVVGTRAAGINASGPHREGATKFLKYLASEKYARLIIRDGDGLPPNPAYARTGADLVNPYVTDPEFHQVFIDAVNAGHVFDTSPYLSADMMGRWMKERIELVENGLATPEQAMKDLAREVNEAIAIAIQRNPSLVKGPAK